MGIASVILFFIYLWGFGFGTAKLLRLKEAESGTEKNIMRLGLGAASLILTAVALNIFKVPLDWRIFLLIALAGPAYHTAKHRKIAAPKIRLRRSEVAALGMLLIFAGSLYMYASGAFSYPWLEDDDPWSHASGIKYVAVEKTFDASPHRGFQYMNPYPPGYDFILALMHQTTPSLYWTMKFFNALIVALSLPFFYYFAKNFLGSRNKALFATAVLAAVPAYQSHFIWAPALAMMIFPAAMYALEMMKNDKKWKFAAAVAIGGLMISHPTHSATLFAMIAIYLLIKLIENKDLRTYLTAGLGGVLLSLTWWGLKGKSFFKANIVPHHGFGEAVAGSTSLIAKIQNAIMSTFPKWSGTASRPYSFGDFFNASSTNMINNPIGFGIMVSILWAVGLVAVAIKAAKAMKGSRIVNSQNSGRMVMLLWLLLAFLTVNNLTFNLPIGFYAFRTWMILAIPVALIAAEGLWGIMELLPKMRLEKSAVATARIGIIAVALLGVWFTSAEAKYELNTRPWAYSGAFWTSQEELNAYVWMRENLEPNTKVLSFLTDDQISGMDMYSCGWCEEVAQYRKTGFEDTPQQTAQWMKENGYEYIVLGGREAAPTEFGQEKVNEKLNEMANSGLFDVAHQTQGAVVLRPR